MLKIFVSLLALAAATPSLAQSVPTADREPTDAGAIRGDDVVVTGSRATGGTPADQLGASITVLDSEALERRQTRVVSDILRDVPGIQVSRAGAVGGITQVRMRGGESNHTLVLIDGIEASDPFQGEFDFAQLIADDVARIEVLRGQQSALYGSDAIGGVIHYITASGAERPGFSARADYGTDDTLSAAARAGGIAGAFDYAVSGAYNRTDGYPVAVGGSRDIGAETVTGSAKANLVLANNLRLRAVARYTHTDADSLDTSPDTFAPIDGTGGYTNRAWLGLVRAELDLLDGRWTHAATAQITDNRRATYDGATGRTRTSANEGRRLKGSYDTSLTLGEVSAQHRITLAADFERETFRNLPPAYPQPLSTTREFENTGLVAEYRFSAGDRFSLGGAVRHDANDRFGDATTYRASASVRVTGPLRVRGAYGTGIKNPTPFELYGYSNDASEFVGNPNLIPEKSRGWEAGADLVLAADRVRIGATWFDSRLKNEIYVAFSPTFVGSPANRTTDSTQHGLELFLAARLDDRLRVDAAYTHLKARENGSEEIRRAPDIASLNVTWTPVDRFSVTATARYNGRTFDSNFTTLPVGPRVRLDDFTLVNLAGEVRITDRLTAFGRVENLLDEDYTEVFGYRTPGRTGAIGLRARF
jgi:vitamin B12 transporter